MGNVGDCGVLCFLPCNRICGLFFDFSDTSLAPSMEPTFDVNRVFLADDIGNSLETAGMDFYQRNQKRGHKYCRCPYTFYQSYRRRHQSLDKRTPDVVYWTTLPKKEAAAWTRAAYHLKNPFCCSNNPDHRWGGGSRTFKLIHDYDTDNVSKKVLRIIMSYTDYVNRTVWYK